MINPKIFKAYDIRGIYPTDINEENFADIIKAIYTLFFSKIGKTKIKISLGYDLRLGSPKLYEVAKKTLVNYGAKVVTIGLTTTPTAYFACLYYQTDAGIQVTASHNPKDYVGIKFFIRKKNNLIKISKNTGMYDVRDIVSSKKFVKNKTKGQLIDKSQEALKDDINFHLNLVQPKITKKFKIVADPANSTSIIYLNEFFKKLPCKLIKMNFNPDPSFPVHQPDPLDFNNLKSLQKKVIEEKADLGIAPDGDGDRIFFIDEKGKVIPATMISSLITNEILSKSPNAKIVVDIRYIRNVINVCKKSGASYSISPVGHALITEQLNREGADFAGESSGHFYFKETGGAESAIRVLLIVLDVMNRENKPISEILAHLHSNYESGEFNFILNEKISSKDIFNIMVKEYNNGQVSWIDGVSIDFPKWRFNLRGSNTEPLIRLNVESEDLTLTNQKLKELTQKIINLGAKPK